MCEKDSYYKFIFLFSDLMVKTRLELIDARPKYFLNWPTQKASVMIDVHNLPPTPVSFRIELYKLVENVFVSFANMYIFGTYWYQNTKIQYCGDLFYRKMGPKQNEKFIEHFGNVIHNTFFTVIQKA